MIALTKCGFRRVTESNHPALIICYSSFVFFPFAYWIISSKPLFHCPWPFLSCLQIIFQAYKSFLSSSLILSSIRLFFFLWEIWGPEPQQESMGMLSLVALELCWFLPEKDLAWRFQKCPLCWCCNFTGPLLGKLVPSEASLDARSYRRYWEARGAGEDGF